MQNLSAQILETIPFSIRTIRRLASSVLQDRITIHHFRILIMVRDGFGQKSIAENLQISEAAVSKTIAHLVEKKFLRKKIGVDKRSREVILTASGKRILDQARKLVEAELSPQISKLSSVQKDQLREGLTVLMSVMSGVKETL